MIRIPPDHPRLASYPAWWRVVAHTCCVWDCDCDGEQGRRLWERVLRRQRFTDGSEQLYVYAPCCDRRSAYVSRQAVPESLWDKVPLGDREATAPPKPLPSLFDAQAA